MPEDLHAFVTGNLWLKLKDDVHDLRIFNRLDLTCAAYFHIRRLLLIQPGWSCRTDLALAPAGATTDLTLLLDGKPQALIELGFHALTPGFPTSELNRKMKTLRQAIAGDSRVATSSSKNGRGYLVSVFETEEEWFYPDRDAWEKRLCFWLPINCRAFADYSEWRQRWERRSRLSSP